MATKRATIPIYLQTAEMLAREIAAGRLIEGEKLPPERDMAAQLGIAVGTLRKSLDDLASKGLLDRVQGSGNYVRSNPEASGIYTFFRLERLEGGGLPTARILSIARLAKPDHLPQFGQARDGHRIRRLRLLSGLPVAFEEIWLDGIWADRIGAEDVSDSLYYFYQRELGLRIARVEDKIGVDTRPSWADADIGESASQIMGRVDRKSRSTEGETVEVSTTWFNPGRARYVARFK